MRANRQPEFSQIDLEMTCPRPDDIVGLVEGMLASVWRRVAGIEVPLPFPRLKYADAMERFGSDKPDLRFDLELKRMDDAFAGTGFKVFAEALARGESIYGIRVPANLQFSRRELDEIADGSAGAPGSGSGLGQDRRCRMAGADREVYRRWRAGRLRPDRWNRRPAIRC